MCVLFARNNEGLKVIHILMLITEIFKETVIFPFVAINETLLLHILCYHRTEVFP